jgi:hypothetical protein
VPNRLCNTRFAAGSWRPDGANGFRPDVNRDSTDVVTPQLTFALLGPHGENVPTSSVGARTDGELQLIDTLHAASHFIAGLHRAYAVGGSAEDEIAGRELDRL